MNTINVDRVVVYSVAISEGKWVHFCEACWNAPTRRDVAFKYNAQLAVDERYISNLLDTSPHCNECGCQIGDAPVDPIGQFVVTLLK